MGNSISVIDPIASLKYLCKDPEHQYLERKGIEEKGISPAKLANEIIGMLNADGGIVALGIDNAGNIQDLKTLDSKLLSRYEKVIQEFIKPPANVKLEKVFGPNKELIFLYHVAQDYENVYSRSDKDNESVYRRVSDSNYGPLNHEEIEKLRHDKSLRSFEEVSREDFASEDLNRETLERYRSQLGYKGTHEDLLLTRNLAIRKYDKVVYRNAAILLFAKDPEKYIASAYVRYVRYDGSAAKTGKDYNVIKDTRFSGNIPEVIDGLKKFIFASLDDYYYLDMESGRFVSVSEYPEAAWLEGVVNALFHRSYNLQGNAIYIKHFDDRLEISNSGPLPAQVTVENIRKQRFSRNPRIGRVLSEMGYVRELNEGVNRIYESMEDSMLSEPEYSDVNDTVTLTLKNKIAKHEKSIPDALLKQITSEWKDYNETEKRILSCLLNHYKATVSDFSQYVGVSEQAIRNYLNKFISKNMIERHSEKLRDKNATYMFRKEH